MMKVYTTIASNALRRRTCSSTVVISSSYNYSTTTTTTAITSLQQFTALGQKRFSSWKNSNHMSAFSSTALSFSTISEKEKEHTSDDNNNNNKNPITNEQLEEALRQFGVHNNRVKDGTSVSSRLLSNNTFRNNKHRLRRRRLTKRQRRLPFPSPSSLDALEERGMEEEDIIYQKFLQRRRNGRRRLHPYNNYYNYEEEEYDDDHDYGISARLRIRSVHAAQTIDLVAVLSKVFMGGGGGVLLSSSSGNKAGGDNGGGTGVISKPPLRHVFGRTSVIVQLPPVPKPSPPPPVAVPTLEGQGNEMSSLILDRRKRRLNHNNNSSNINDIEQQKSSLLDSQLEPCRYVAIFRFGSVVFFNVSPKESGQILEEIKKHGVDPISPGFERKEYFEVAIKPGMQENAQHVNGDFATIKELDMNSVAVISTIMGQTVALDSYGMLVDELLANFAIINSTVKRTGNFTEMEKEKLFKVVAQNNSLFIDMISKLGIKDRSDTAWNLSQYERVHEGMKEEFEIEDRFEHIEFKLNLIQQNAKFFLEVLHAQKTNSLEWIIIVLISFECVLMCLEMSGMGGTLFQAILPS